MPRSWLARWKPELAILVVAFALRLALFLAVGAWDVGHLKQRIFVGDARDYHHLATNLAEHGVYSSSRRPPLVANTFRVPLYPAYLALCYRLFGPLPHLAILMQLLLGAFTCVVTCRAGTLLFDRRAGIAAGAILAIDYSAVLFSNRLYADTLFTLLVALALLALSRFLVAGGGVGCLIAAGASLGLASLARPVGLYFVIALLPVLWLARRSIGATGRDQPDGARYEVRPVAGRLAVVARAWGVLVIVYLLTLAPWMLRNLAVAGSPYVTSMQTKIVDWYVPRIVDAPLSPTSRDGARTEIPSPAPPRSAVGKLVGDAFGFGRGFVRYFAILGSGEYPLILGVQYHRHDASGLREASLWQWVSATLRDRSSPLERTLVIAIMLYLLTLYAAAARGVWVALRRGRRTAAALLLATVVYFMVATGPLAREIRYRLPALPAIALFAGLGLVAPRRERDAGQTSRRSEASSRRSAA